MSETIALRPATVPSRAPSELMSGAAASASGGSASGGAAAAAAAGAGASAAAKSRPVRRKRKALDWSSAMPDEDADFSDDEQRIRPTTAHLQHPRTTINPARPRKPPAPKAKTTATIKQEVAIQEDVNMEDVAPAADTPPLLTSSGRSARQAATKRKSYKDPGESDIEQESSDDEKKPAATGRGGDADDDADVGPNSKASAAAAGSSTAKKKQKKSAASDPQFIELNGCLGRSQIERILARKRMPGPSVGGAPHFLSTFLRHLPPELLERVHPSDLAAFAPEAYREYEHTRKRAEEVAMLEEERRRQREREEEAAAAVAAGGADSLPDNARPEPHQSFSLTASIDVAPEPVPEQRRPLMVSQEKEEFYYLVKWRGRSYSALSLHWLPHSLVMLFNDGASRVRRYEKVREYGETSGKTRISHSDEELEEDEARIMRLATGLQRREMDERTLRREVERKEATVRAAREAAETLPASTSTIANTSAGSPEQLASLESSLEAARIARRLADISADHKLTRLKKIRTGFFDRDFQVVERIVGHRRRTKRAAGAAQANLYFSPDTPKEHWAYYGLEGKSVQLVEAAFSQYLHTLDGETRKYMLALAEAIDPRVLRRREEVEGAPSIQCDTERAEEAERERRNRAEEKDGANEEEEESKSNAMEEEEKISSKPTPTPAAAAADTSTAVPMDISSPSPSPRRPAVSSASPSAASPSALPATSSRGRRIRKPKSLADSADDGGEGEDEEELRKAMRASKAEATAVARASAGKQAQQDEDAHMQVDAAAASADDADDDAGEQFEFLVKWTKLSYDACTWETRANLKRMDAVRAEHLQLTRANSAAQGGLLELNGAVPIPPLSNLPFMPLSSLAFCSNLFLKYLDLPILAGDVTTAAQDAISASIHPVVALSAVVDNRHAHTTSASSGGAAQAPAAVHRSCMDALRRYFLLHSKTTLDSSIVYPSHKAADLNGEKTNTFPMTAAAVTPASRFGADQSLALRSYQVDSVNFLALNWSIGRNSILADDMGLGKTVNCAALLSWLVTKQHFAHPLLVVAPLSTVGFWLREIERFSNLYGVIYRGQPESRKMLREWEWRWPSSDQMDELNGIRREEGVDAATDVPANQRVPAPAGGGGCGAKGLVRRPYKFNVLITSYEFILNDHAIFARIPFSALIIDEAQRLKSHESKLWEKLSSLKVKRKLLLTGTPIQNSMTELWSLLHFIEPTHFASMHAFLESFGAMDSVSHVTRLYHELKPYVLRRLKSDVEKGLPPKEEILVEIPLTRVQQKYYKAVYERNYKMLTKTSAENNGGARQINSLINVSMQLRKVSQHPYLLDGAEEEELGLLNASGHTRALTPDQIMEKLVSCSGKFLLLDKLLPKLKSEGHRVLIFSQMTRLLDILQDFFAYRRYSCERLDGNVGAAERQQAIDKFNAPGSDIFAFLLSTRAGGLGITLTSADTVIIFDSDWNLANDNQAIDRTHRIGQTREIKIYRLLTKDTYEMTMFHRSCLKLTLDHVVMASMSQEVGAASMSDDQMKQALKDRSGKGGKKRKGGKNSSGAGGAANGDDDAAMPFDRSEIETMLKQGAYNVFGNPDADGGAAGLKSLEFAEEDIGVILRRAQVVKYSSEGKEGEGAPVPVAGVPGIEGVVAGALNADGSHSSSASPPAASSASPAPAVKNSTFSKASFVPAGGGDALSLSDPDFWSKIGLQDKSTEDDAENGGPLGAAVIMDGKRIRKPVQVYQAGDADTSERRTSSSLDIADYSGRPTSNLEGPPRCQVCLLITREDESMPILICDFCSEEVHLTCLGLHAIPEEDHWACPSCVAYRKKQTKKKSALDEEDEADYADAATMKAAAGAQRNNVSGSTPPLTPLTIRPPKQSRLDLAALTPQALKRRSKFLTGKRLHKDYTRLIQTYRTAYPAKTDEDVLRMAESTWKRVLQVDPPEASIGRKQPTTADGTGTPAQKGSQQKPIDLSNVASPQKPSKRSSSSKRMSDVVDESSSMEDAQSSQWLLPNYNAIPPASFDGFASYYGYLQQSGMYTYHSLAFYGQPSPSAFLMPTVPPSSSYGPPFPASHPQPSPPRAKCDRRECMSRDGDAGALDYCSRCRVARYCSRRCHQLDWTDGHAQACVQDQTANDAAPAPASVAVT